MKRLLFVLLLIPSIAFAAPPEVPWKTFSAAVPDVVGSLVGMCEGGVEVAIIRLQHPTGDWAFYWVSETGRLMVLYWVPKNDGTPDWIGLGQTGEAVDVIPPLQWYTGAEIMAKYASPCAYLAGDART